MSLKQVFETFELVAGTSGRNSKMALLDGLVKTDQITFREVIQYAMNPFWTYRISAPDLSGMLPKWDSLNDTQSDIMWVHFKSLLDELRTRLQDLSTGRAEMKSVIGIQPALYRKYLAQIVNRDLKIGVQDFNKFFPHLIPAEPVMLCDKWDGEDLNGNWTAEPKLDGYRAAVVIDAEGNVDAISRGNKEFWNWNHIANEIKALGLRSMVFDGEFYAGNFGLTGSICKTQAPHKDRLKLKYHIFDMLTLDEWNATKCTRNTIERKDVLRATLEDLPSFYLIEVVGIPVHSPEDFLEASDFFYNQGYEGTVLKDMAAAYEWDRSSKWLKIKPEEDADVTITGVEEGKNRHTGRLGAFWVKGTVTYKKKIFEIVSKVGGGLKDTERDEFWQMHLEGRLSGIVIEVTYQDVTSEVCIGTTVPSLRFPKFKRVRWDKTPIELGGK